MISRHRNTFTNAPEIHDAALIREVDATTAYCGEQFENLYELRREYEAFLGKNLYDKVMHFGNHSSNKSKDDSQVQIDFERYKIQQAALHYRVLTEHQLVQNLNATNKLYYNTIFQITQLFQK